MRAPNLMYIDGEWVAAGDGKSLAIIDPATEEQVDTIPRATAADLDDPPGDCGGLGSRSCSR
jgi:acyl-CoA reductase-like NAD-dependent aldehyde dehydrogenase